MANKYVSPNKLSVFLENLKNVFSPLVHTHKISEIVDYTVDYELSSTSNNPVANSVINDEFDAISNAMGALELAIDEHTHTVSDISDLTVTANELNFVAGITSNIQTQFDNLIKVFIGTYAQYETANANGEIPINTLVILTDDGASSGDSSSGGDSSAYTSSILGTGALGYMILG